MKSIKVLNFLMYCGLLIHIGYSFIKQELVTMNYIGKYTSIAISEMHRTGIPASIKLGQAILESSAGQSDLAISANNHFGIKCGSMWQGPRMYVNDDDYNSKGELIESCFRVFRDVESSFVAHSDFLYHPDEGSRYDFLFQFESDDYHSWAFGLKKAGYATDPKYADKLIDIIDKYQLYDYDLGVTSPKSSEVNIESAPQDTIMDVTAMFAEALAKREASGYVVPRKEERISKKSNPVERVYEKDDANRDVTKKREVTTKKNDPISDKAALEKKIAKNRFFAKKGEHVVLPDESLKAIARRYGLSLHKLCAYNRIPEGTYPIAGEILKTDGYVHWGKRPKTKRRNSKDKEEFLFSDPE